MVGALAIPATAAASFSSQVVSPTSGDPFDFDSMQPGRQSIAPANVRTLFSVLGQGGDDRIFLLTAEASLLADGGDGDDIVVGSDDRDALRGGNGDDLVAGNGTSDSIDLGPGDDRYEGTPKTGGSDGNDQAFGGAGDDVLRGESLSGGPGNDSRTLDVGARPILVAEDDDGYDVTRLVTGGGADVLRGSEGIEWLAGALGDDVLDGGPGPDRLLADPLDPAGGCEQLLPGPAAGAVALARVTATDILRLEDPGVVEVPVTCSQGARGGCAGTLTLGTADPVTIGDAHVPVRLGSRTFTLAPGTTAQIAVSVDKEDFVRAVDTLELDVDAQVVTAVAEHTTRLPMTIRK